MGPPLSSKKRKVADGMRGKAGRPTKKFKKQQHYNSDSEEEEDGRSHATGVNQVEQSLVRRAKNPHTVQEKKTPTNAQASSLASSDDEANDENASDSCSVTNGSSSGEESNSNSDSDSHIRSRKRKRNDPDAFAMSISRILSSKLTTTKRTDPVLARSKDAAVASQELLDARLSAKAHSLLRAQKKAELDRGRVKDILGPGEDIGRTLETEKKLKKTAQRGVVKLFNAVRAAQVKGEEAAREARQVGVVGKKMREEKVTEMSKKGFLELIAGGGVRKTRELEEG